MEFIDLVDDVLREIELFLLAVRDRRAFAITCRRVHTALTGVRLWGTISPTIVQVEALEFLRRYHTSYLNLPMSMGKTAVGLRLAMEDTGVGMPDGYKETKGTIVIIAPTMLWKEVWMREIKLMCRYLDEKKDIFRFSYSNITKLRIGDKSLSFEGKIIFISSSSLSAGSSFSDALLPVLPQRRCLLIDEVQKGSILPYFYDIRTSFHRVTLMSADKPNITGNTCAVSHWHKRTGGTGGRRQKIVYDRVPIYSRDHSEIAEYIPDLHLSLAYFNSGINGDPRYTKQDETGSLRAILKDTKRVAKDREKILALVHKTGKLVCIGRYVSVRPYQTPPRSQGR